ncbi:small acid-soluble spore protein O [Pseudalkalibacillus decolorationis]|nr:small acid-soluble spore protein O [Pseudalkalibacillus decolorationis]
MATKKQNLEKNTVSDRQAVKQSNQFDHEFANEPLQEIEKQNNKKRKKNQ